jgi:hypothetical protein
MSSKGTEKLRRYKRVSLLDEEIKLDFKKKYIGSFYTTLKFILKVNKSLQYTQKW